MAYNYLSGYSIDNVSSLLYSLMNDGQCYLGYSRGTQKNQWGISTLIQIEHVDSPSVSARSFPDSVVVRHVSDITASHKKFTDLQSLKLVNSTQESAREIVIKKFANNAYGTAIAFGNVGDTLKLTYVDSNWALISGLKSDYYNHMTPSTTASYYIFNASDTTYYNSPIKISNKNLSNVSSYAVDCKLVMNYGSHHSIVKDNIQVVTNVLGEVYVKGMKDSSLISETDIDMIFNMGVSAQEKKQLLTDSGTTFTLYNTNGNTIFDNMTFYDPNSANVSQLYEESTVATSGSAEKFVTFSYTNTGFPTQFIKFVIGDREQRGLAIWTESLPYTTTIPVADANPPSLDVSYLKNPVIHSSIFDVSGLIKIQPTDIKFVSEILDSTTTESLITKGFNIETISVSGDLVTHSGRVKTRILSTDNTFIIHLENFHTFVIGDLITIPLNPGDTSLNPHGITYTVIAINKTSSDSSITLATDQVTRIVLQSELPSGYVLTSNPTNVISKVLLATTTNMNKALANGFNNLMVTKTIDLIGANSPTENIYRQLFICFKPKDSTGTICTNDVYTNDVTDVLFNTNTWSYDIGTLMYVSNKIPFYRKWANDKEQFTIIL